jgi:anti-anti-sigma regulatory factor
VDKKIQNIFVVTRLSLVFETYETEDEAIKSFK